MAPPNASHVPVTHTVLVVDDDDVDRHALVRALESVGEEGWEVHTTTVAEAPRVLEQRDFDCVVLDFCPADPDPLGLLKELRTSHGHPEVPVILVTRGEDDLAGLEGLARGAQDYLYKGDLSPRILLRSLRYAMERHSLLAEIQEREERLRRAQRMDSLGRLAGGIAHDFNNLLTAISGFTAQASGKLQAEHPARGDLEQIARAAEHSAALTRQILAFAREQRLEPVVLDLGELVARLRPLLDRLLGAAYELECALEPECRALVDGGQLEQVLLNLVLNARDAMPDGGRIRVAVERRQLPGSAEPLVQLAVQDRGVGMDAATQARVFEPFFTTKAEGQGTGLGLAVVHGIVTQSGGRVELESGPGVGTTVRVQLRAVGPAPPPPGGETLLLVEDEELVREFLSEVLAGEGYRVLGARDAATALELCEAEDGPIDLLLTDVTLPGVSGPKLARQLARRRPGLRVIFCSGRGRDEALGSGFPDALFLPKPVSLQTLLQVVREGLARRRG